MTFEILDRQLCEARRATETPDLSEFDWTHLATTIHGEVSGLGEAAMNHLRSTTPIPPERYIEELVAFQEWMEIAHANESNPVIVRAQVMTQLYVSFVWLRDSLMRPIADALPEKTTFRSVESFLRTGQRKTLRNAIAHGRWCYLADFSGLECWDGRDYPGQRFVVSEHDFRAWQMLSRGTTIAALTALTAPKISAATFSAAPVCIPADTCW